MSKAIEKNTKRRVAQLARLGEFCSAFEAEGFKFGEVRGGEQDSDGAIQMPHYAMSKMANSFHQHCYDDGWVLCDFDWLGWVQSTEAVALLQERMTLIVSREVV